MDRNQLVELHYITPIENVSSMLEHGLLSHRRARRLDHRSVAMEEVQERRARVSVPGGQPLHDYVNLYINGRNPMMFTVLRKGTVDELCLLRVSADVVDIDGVVIADCNASSDYVRFADATRGLRLIDDEEAFAQYWTHPGDPIAQTRHKSRMCAEVLVPDRVEPAYIHGAYVGSTAGQQQLQAAAPGLGVTIDGYKFFR